MVGVFGQWMHGYGWNAWWMGISMLLFWAVVITVVVLLIRASAQRDDGVRRARDVLAQRYARGEIDTEEFASRARELESLQK